MYNRFSTESVMSLWCCLPVDTQNSKSYVTLQFLSEQMSTQNVNSAYEKSFLFWPPTGDNGKFSFRTSSGTVQAANSSKQSTHTNRCHTVHCCGAIHDL